MTAAKISSGNMAQRLNNTARLPLRQIEQVIDAKKDIIRKTGCIINIVNKMTVVKNEKLMIGWSVEKASFIGNLHTESFRNKKRSFHKKSLHQVQDKKVPTKPQSRKAWLKPQIKFSGFRARCSYHSGRTAGDSNPVTFYICIVLFTLLIIISNFTS